MNPKQIFVAEPKLLINKGEVDPKDFAIHSIESGLLLSLESECTEGKVNGRSE